MTLADEPRTGVLHPEQPTAPYLDAVWGYAFRGSTRFHVPGHKGGAGADPGLRSAIGASALMVDVPADIQGIDLGPAPTPYQRAEALAAEAHGAARSWFLTNGASQGNHALTLALAPLGAHVVVQRNSHASVVDGLVLSGGVPTYVAPEYEDELGMAHGVTPEALEAAIVLADGPRAVFIVSPTYYGMAADVAGCAAVCHDAGIPLVVDQAWGPHFGFHPDVPPSALALGADAVLTSTHKIVGSLTQSAMLHVGPTGRIDPDQVARMVRLTRSTSPSALLMASLDAARRQLAVHGEALLDRTMAAGDRARAAIDAVPGVRVIGDEFVGQPGVAAWDPMRIVIDVRGTGCTGYEVAAALRDAFDIHVELATHATMVLILGLSQPPDDLERFAHDFGAVVRRIARPGDAAALVRAPGALENEVVVAPREAFLGDAEAVPVDTAVGRVSAEAIAGYPPGIPALLPGERITTELVAYLRELKAAGARLHGASDPRIPHDLRAARGVISRYRRAGADPPWCDPRRYHGVAMEGYFWRFTHAPSGRVAIVMCGVNRSAAGERWAFVGLASHPGGFFRWAALQDAEADAAGYGVRAGAAFSAGPEHVRLDLGPDCRLDVELAASVAWPRRAFGGLGGAHAVPGLTQYWHPHLFAADVRGRVVAGADAFSLDGAGAYAEKNWGGGFPDRWWWGQAHDFGEDVSVAFAGGPVGVRSARLEATAAVVRLGGTVLRCRPPAAIELGHGAWRLRARAPGGRQLELEGAADPATAHALTVPVPSERRAVDRSQHHLAGDLRLRVTRRGRTVFAGASQLAGLERGGGPSR